MKPGRRYRVVNSAMVDAYWNIGRLIVEDEQKGGKRAEYGAKLLKNLSVMLSRELGKGFDISNLKRMRQFYCLFPIGAAVRHQLSEESGKGASLQFRGQVFTGCPRMHLLHIKQKNISIKVSSDCDYTFLWYNAQE